ncbi:MAG: hypothetical protein K2X27_15050 [Candidatus Obscuribacterales bacterium]|nr:hypothetical protein [Candidatus Obscuribacterales bacterium]
MKVPSFKKALLQKGGAAALFGLLFLLAMSPAESGEQLAVLSIKAKDSISKIQADNPETTDMRKEKSRAQESDKLAAAQARNMNRIPGLKVNPKDLKQEDLEKGPGLNPLGWIFRPLTKLQAQSVRLEQQIMKLTGPIASLQPAMLGLDSRMSEVNSQMGKVGHKMDSVENSMHSVDRNMRSVETAIESMRSDISGMRSQMGRLEKPMTALQEPLQNLSQPISTVSSRLDGLEKQLSELRTMIALVLTSIYLSAALIAIGTPLAAALIWQHRRKIFSKETMRELPSK